MRVLRGRALRGRALRARALRARARADCANSTRTQAFAQTVVAHRRGLIAQTNKADLHTGLADCAR